MNSPGSETNIYDEPKIDCHCHVIDPARFPYGADTFYRPSGQETGSARQLAQMHDAYGVRHGLIVGTNSGYEEEMRRLAASVGVRFEPRKLISDEEVVETLNRAALFIYTSRLEPFGLAPLEANACGTPVVAVAEGGVRETVKDGVNGLLVDSEPEAIAETMASLLGNADRAVRMGERACEYVRQEWGLSRSIDRLEANLSQVINRASQQGKKACSAR